jgi:hypothetical protein
MIQEGLLWFDDDPARATGDKIARAAQRYRQKYGHSPDVCYVHPAHLKEGGTPLKGVLGMGLSEEIKVLPAKSVLPHHFWLGVLGQKEGRGGRRASGAPAG